MGPEKNEPMPTSTTALWVLTDFTLPRNALPFSSIVWGRTVLTSSSPGTTDMVGPLVMYASSQCHTVLQYVVK